MLHWLFGIGDNFFDFGPYKGIELYSSLSAQVAGGFVDEDFSMVGAPLETN